MNMKMRLLATKLRIPPRRGELVPRARLVERLDQGLEHKLTLVSAPAGFGKTTLVAQWAAARRQEQRFTAGWLALDGGDNDLVRFLNYLSAALQEAIPAIEEEVRPMLQSPHPPPAEEVLTALINQVVAASPPHMAAREDAAPRPQFVLIVDDYHLITAAEIHEAVSFLLEHQPSCLHLILITRADPPLPLPRLRSQGQLLELRQTDLRFSRSEAAVFLEQVMGIMLEDAEVATLATRTEGWIAGLQMAALALRGRPDEETADFVADFTGTHRYVLDYLLEEVLQRQPAAVQQFLLQTSILERLTAPLCDFVLSDGQQNHAPLPEPRSQEILDYLDAHNLFLVPLDDQRRWYRYHRLFAELLQLRLQQTMPALLTELHRRAASWYEAQGETTAAITHLLAAGDTERAAALVAASAESAVMRGEVMTLLHWGEALPESAVAARPQLALLYAWALLLGGRPASSVERWLQEVEAGEATAGWTSAIRGYLQLFQEEMSGARRLAQRALSTLPAEAVFLRQLAILVLSIAARYQDEGPDPEQALVEASRAGVAAENIFIAVFGLCLRADLALRRGDLPQAQAIYEQALRLAKGKDGRPLPVASEPLLGLATLALERFELAKAEQLLQEGMALTRQWSRVAAIDGYLLQARLHHLRQEHAAMWSVLEQAAAVARRFDAVETDDLVVALFRIQTEIRLGRLALARRGLEAHSVRTEAAVAEMAAHPPPVRKYEYLLLARLLIAEGRLEEAETLLDILLPHFDRHRARIMVHLLYAVVREQRGEREAALAALAEALALGEAADMVAVFVEEGKPVARLLYHALKQGVAPVYVSRLLGAFPGARKEEVAPTGVSELVEPLSERELEVLALVAEGLTNQEIADRLFLSLATVKWHTSNIYGKLAVNNRTEAVAKAQALGLLSHPL